jgi:hypothetical protein
VTEIRGLLFLTFVVASVTYFLVVTGIAYNQRNDKSFGGGYFILMGWWLIWPHGKGGVPESSKKLIRHGRVSAVLFYSAIWLFTWVVTK